MKNTVNDSDRSLLKYRRFFSFLAFSQTIMFSTEILILCIALLTPSLGFQCTSPGSFPNPDDCHSYFVCTEYEMVKMECPVDTAFDPVLKICGYTDSVDCSVQPSTTGKTTTQGLSTASPTSSSTSTTVSPTSSSTSTTASGSSTPQTPQGPFTCPTSGLQPYPNPSDCSTFYLCRNGSLDIITCPVGYQFDTIDTRCELIGSAQCDGEVTSSTIKPHSTETPNYDCGEHLNGMTFPDPTDCTKYYQCSNGNIVGNHCAPGLQFNSELLVCDNPANVHCNVTGF